jgi:acyl-coenzyme A thioesterase PaaI-like protein
VAEASHIVAEMGFTVAVDGPGAVGRAEIFPEVCVPGSATLRTSVLATWVDVVTGWLAVASMAPRIPLTLDLEVQVVEPVTAGDTILVEASVVKHGRSVFVTEARFRRQAAGLVAVGTASFIASPNPDHRFPPGFRTLPPRQDVIRMPEPLAERAGCRVVTPGTAEVPRQPRGLNSSGGIQGGLVALAAEEAAASLAETPAYLETLNLRYLRPFAVGPARAVAERHGDLSLVRLTDAGTDKLGAAATARLARAY